MAVTLPALPEHNLLAFLCLLEVLLFTPPFNLRVNITQELVLFSFIACPLRFLHFYASFNLCNYVIMLSLLSYLKLDNCTSILPSNQVIVPYLPFP